VRTSSQDQGETYTIVNKRQEVACDRGNKSGSPTTANYDTGRPITNTRPSGGGQSDIDESDPRRRPLTSEPQSLSSSLGSPPMALSSPQDEGPLRRFSRLRGNTPNRKTNFTVRSYSGAILNQRRGHRELFRSKLSPMLDQRQARYPSQGE